MGVVKDFVETVYLIADRLKRRREARRPNRPFLVEPLRTADRRLGKHLVETVRAGAGVPLIHSKGENVLADFVRVLASIFVLRDASRKPAFLIAAWKHAPAEDFDRDLAFTATAGTVLFAVLADVESSGHFMRSTTAGPAGGRRLIAIARPEDLCDPTAWVRCVYVNTLTAEVVDTARGPRTGLVLPSSMEIDTGKATATRKRQKDIPPNAMWLFCDSGAQPEPSADWGDYKEQFAATPRPTKPPLQESGLVRQLARSNRWVGPVVWLAGGPAIGAILYPWPFSVDFYAFEQAMQVISLAWLAVAAIVGAVGIWSAAASMVRSRYWRWREEAEDRCWKGGTARSVFLGQVLQGVFLSKGTDASELWSSMWPEFAPNDKDQNGRGGWRHKMRNHIRRGRSRSSKGRGRGRVREIA